MTEEAVRRWLWLLQPNQAPPEEPPTIPRDMSPPLPILEPRVPANQYANCAKCCRILKNEEHCRDTGACSYCCGCSRHHNGASSPMGQGDGVPPFSNQHGSSKTSTSAGPYLPVPGGAYPAASALDLGGTTTVNSLLAAADSGHASAATTTPRVTSTTAAEARVLSPPSLDGSLGSHNKNADTTTSALANENGRLVAASFGQRYQGDYYTFGIDPYSLQAAGGGIEAADYGAGYGNSGSSSANMASSMYGLQDPCNQTRLPPLMAGDEAQRWPRDESTATRIGLGGDLDMGFGLGPAWEPSPVQPLLGCPQPSQAYQMPPMMSDMSFGGDRSGWQLQPSPMPASPMAHHGFEMGSRYSTAGAQFAPQAAYRDGGVGHGRHASQGWHGWGA